MMAGVTASQLYVAQRRVNEGVGWGNFSGDADSMAGRWGVEGRSLLLKHVRRGPLPAFEGNKVIREVCCPDLPGKLQALLSGACPLSPTF